MLSPYFKSLANVFESLVLSIRLKALRAHAYPVAKCWWHAISQLANSIPLGA